MKNALLLMPALTAASLIALPGAAAAQEDSLERAWALCERVVAQPDPAAALAQEAPRAGFPLHRAADDKGAAAFGRILSGTAYSLSAFPADEDFDEPASCSIVMSAVDSDALIARADTYWRGRGLPTDTSHVFSAGGRTSDQIHVTLTRPREGFLRWVISAPFSTD